MELVKGTKLRVGDKVFVEGVVLNVEDDMMPNEIELPYNTKVFLRNSNEQLYKKTQKSNSHKGSDKLLQSKPSVSRL